MISLSPRTCQSGSLFSTTTTTGSMALNAALLLAPLVFLFVKLFRWGRRDAHLPPGPPTTPFLGNILQLPSTHLQLQFTEWARTYGDVISVKVFNSTMIVLSSASAVRAVMDKQGGSTGGRPRTLLWPIFRGLYVAFESQDTPVWKRGRKTMHRFLAPEAFQHNVPVQQAEMTQLVNDLLDDPMNIYTHIMRSTCSIMTSLLYGKRTPTYYGTDAEGFFEGVKLANAAADAAAFPPVEIMPFVDYIPKWIAPWTAHIEKTKTLRDELYYRLFEEAEEKFAKGHHTNSYVEDLLKNQELLGVSREEMVFFAMVLMDAGVETSTSFIQNIVLAFLTYPECQKKAQEEMDRVVGGARMPTLEDYEELPYLRAFVEELQRFRPLFPVALPHMVTEDVSYNGHVLPKGSMLFQNTWAIFHDPDLYDEPDVFRPERFLESKYGTKKGADVSELRDNFAFGSGRRICPGEEIGRRSIAINAMNFAWAFNITSDVKMTLDMDRFIVPGIEIAPKPFTCKATIRDAGREKLVRSAHAASQKD